LPICPHRFYPLSAHPASLKVEIPLLPESLPPSSFSPQAPKLFPEICQTEGPLIMFFGFWNPFSQKPSFGFDLFPAYFMTLKHSPPHSFAASPPPANGDSRPFHFFKDFRSFFFSSSFLSLASGFISFPSIGPERILVFFLKQALPVFFPPPVFLWFSRLPACKSLDPGSLESLPPPLSSPLPPYSRAHSPLN